MLQLLYVPITTAQKVVQKAEKKINAIPISNMGNKMNSGHVSKHATTGIVIPHNALSEKWGCEETVFGIELQDHFNIGATSFQLEESAELSCSRGLPQKVISVGGEGHCGCSQPLKKANIGNFRVIPADYRFPSHARRLSLP